MLQILLGVLELLLLLLQQGEHVPLLVAHRARVDGNARDRPRLSTTDGALGRDAGVVVGAGVACHTCLLMLN